MKLAVLGLGNIGRAFASRALDKGHEVTVWNRSPDAAAKLVSSGATHAESIAAAVSSSVDVALVLVSDDAAVEAVCLGDDGALASLGAETVLANVSTVSPQTARRLADAGPADRVLDTPVMGAPALVAQGGSRLLIGGSQQVATQLDPLWLDLTAGYTYCGPAGSGATMKLMTNLQLIAGVTALAESITIARAHGLPDDLIREVFATSPVISAASQARLDSLLATDHPGWFAPELARKDLRLALSLAAQSAVPVAVGPAVEKLLTTVIDAGGSWPDFTAVIEALS